MSWFRTKLKHSAMLALMAFAINLALAFGHCHVGGARDHQAAAGLPDSGVSDDGGLPLNTNGDDDGCAICKTVAAIGTALAPTSAVLPVAFSYARLDLTPANAIGQRQCARTDVRARGPPPLTSPT